ncbi:hypothetical protein DFH29DRAFT_875809 [Suillus ampliporus]|nr:hypothetical protein DFH29DRAFT_875809 [Suillus ampliporus]
MPRRNQSAEVNAEDAVFVKDGYPVSFFFHASVREGIDVLKQEITRYGGEVSEDEQQADVILVDEEADIEHIRRRYYRSNVLWQQRVYIERRDFVRLCIGNRKYEHRRPQRKGMPGAPGGRIRVPFTPEDDEHLAFYIATVIPNAADGGRTGNLMYKTLTEELNTPSQAFEPEYTWAKRHTWQSWRERYKTKIRRFDPMIARYAAQLKNVTHGFGHDPRSHRYRHGRPVRGARHMEEEEEESDRELEQHTAGGAEPEDLDNQVPGGIPQVRDEVQENDIPDHEPGPAQPQLRRRRRDDPDTSQHASFQGESPQKRQRVASPATPSEPRASAMEKGRRASEHGRPGRNSNEKDQRSPEEGNSESFAQGALDGAISFDINQMPEPNVLPVPQSPEHEVPEAEPDEPLATQETLVDSLIEVRSRPAPSARDTAAVVQGASTSSQATPIAQPLPAARTTPSRRGRAQREESPPAEVPTPVAGTEISLQVKPTRMSSKSRGHQPVVVASDAPYRHTRARSQSIDLPPQPAPASKRRRVVSAKGKSKEMALEEVPEEDAQRNVDEGGDSQVRIAEKVVEQNLDDGAEQGEQSSEGAQLPSHLRETETFKEERDVEHDLLERGRSLFTDDEDESSSDESSNRGQEFTVDSSSEEPSDSDDAATHVVLRQDPLGQISRLPNTSASTSNKATTKSSAIRVARHAAQAPPFPSPGTKANARLREKRGN